jgi:hypothetical protein
MPPLHRLVSVSSSHCFARSLSEYLEEHLGFGRGTPGVWGAISRPPMSFERLGVGDQPTQWAERFGEGRTLQAPRRAHGEPPEVLAERST